MDYPAYSQVDLPILYSKQVEPRLFAGETNGAGDAVLFKVAGYASRLHGGVCMGGFMF